MRADTRWWGWLGTWFLVLAGVFLSPAWAQEDLEFSADLTPLDPVCLQLFDAKAAWGTWEEASGANPEVLTCGADLYLGEGDLEGYVELAQRAWVRGLVPDPELEFLGQTLLRLGRWRESIPVFEQVLRGYRFHGHETQAHSLERFLFAFSWAAGDQTRSREYARRSVDQLESLDLRTPTLPAQLARAYLPVLLQFTLDSQDQDLSQRAWAEFQLGGWVSPGLLVLPWLGLFLLGWLGYRSMTWFPRLARVAFVAGVLFFFVVGQGILSGFLRVWLFPRASGVLAWSSPEGTVVYLTSYALAATGLGLGGLWQARRLGFSDAELGLSQRPTGRHLLLGALGAILIHLFQVFVWVVVVRILRDLGIELPMQSNIPAGIRAYWGRPWVLFGLVTTISAVAALTEEAFFRVYLFSAWRKDWGPFFGSLFAAMVFAGIHFQALLNLFFAGLVFQVLLVRTRSIWPSVFCHFFQNLAATLFVLLR